MTDQHDKTSAEPHQETAPLTAIKDALAEKSFLMARLPGTPDTHEMMRVVALTDAWEILEATIASPPK